MADEGKTINELAQEVPERRATESEEAAESEVAEALDDARDQLGIDDNLDPLEALLSSTKKLTSDVPIPRLKTNFTVRAIPDQEEYKRLTERCTEVVRMRRGATKEKLNTQRLTMLIVAGYTSNPAFSPEVNEEGYRRLVEKFKTQEPEDLVERCLMIGEIEKLADAILSLSGFDDGELMVTAGN